jgi:hypothetical protein
MHIAIERRLYSVAKKKKIERKASVRRCFTKEEDLRLFQAEMQKLWDQLCGVGLDDTVVGRRTENFLEFNNAVLNGESPYTYVDKLLKTKNLVYQKETVIKRYYSTLTILKRRFGK